ncbi:MAG: hypothetical protein H7320_11615 [Ferruginibacter sp.]|nr:hypothetical protein [Ferruginibacter sp.]
MFETIRTWLNGTREYFTGVAIFNKFSDNTILKEVFSAGKSAYKEERLFDEIKNYYSILKDEQSSDAVSVVDEKETNIIPPVLVQKKTIEDYSDTELFKQAHQGAMKLYKQCINIRAQLFGLATVETWQDQNSPDMIAKRAQMAIEVVMLYNEASKLFEVADYVKLHNRLPVEVVPIEEDPYSNVPDFLIKQELSNARKAFNKLKNKPVTDERLVLMAKHEANIKILEKKWHSLSLIAT